MSSTARLIFDGYCGSVCFVNSYCYQMTGWLVLLRLPMHSFQRPPQPFQSIERRSGRAAFSINSTCEKDGTGRVLSYADVIAFCETPSWSLSEAALFENVLGIKRCLDTILEVIKTNLPQYLGETYRWLFESFWFYQVDPGTNAIAWMWIRPFGCQCKCWVTTISINFVSSVIGGLRLNYGAPVRRGRVYFLLVRSDLMSKAAKDDFPMWADVLAENMKAENDYDWYLGQSNSLFWPELVHAFLPKGRPASTRWPLDCGEDYPWKNQWKCTTEKKQHNQKEQTEEMQMGSEAQRLGKAQECHILNVFVVLFGLSLLNCSEFTHLIETMTQVKKWKGCFKRKYPAMAKQILNQREMDASWLHNIQSLNIYNCGLLIVAQGLGYCNEVLQKLPWNQYFSEYWQDEPNARYSQSADDVSHVLSLRLWLLDIFPVWMLHIIWPRPHATIALPQRGRFLSGTNSDPTQILSDRFVLHRQVWNHCCWWGCPLTRWNLMDSKTAKHSCKIWSE